jgi:hypothetical protein
LVPSLFICQANCLENIGFGSDFVLDLNSWICDTLTIKGENKMFKDLLLAIRLEHDYMKDLVGQDIWRLYSQAQRKKWLMNNGILHFLP